ncbi:Phage tail protein [Enterococcus phage Q69]|nr:Phage tail protein [Enterococcus phage Q69]
MDFYVTDREFTLKTIISTEGNTVFKVVSSKDTIELSTASRRLDIDVSFTHDTTDKAKEYFKVGNYFLYKDLNGKFIWATIMKATHDPLNQVRSLELEVASLDLLNETVPEYSADKQYTAKEYIEMFTWDSGYTVGINEIPNLKRTLKWDSAMTALERIQSVATQFDNAELEFTYDFDGNKLTQRKINIYKKRGKNTNHTLYVNKDINSITTEEDIYSLLNSAHPVGGTPEGKDEPITLKGFNWTDPYKRFTVDPKGGYVYDTQNIKEWSRTNTTTHYFMQELQFEAMSQQKLLDETILHLKKYSKPIVSYNVDIANIPYQLEVGDTLKLVDENEKLYLQSRVQQLEYDYTTNTCEATLSDFVRLESGISDELRKLANDLQANLNKGIKSVPKVYVQPDIPVNAKEGDIWWVSTTEQQDYEVRGIDNGLISGYKVFRGGQWVEQTIDQSILNIETLNAVNINGSTINGSEFITTWNTTTGDVRKVGSAKLSDGTLGIENYTYATHNGVETLRKLDISTIYNSDISNFAQSYDMETGLNITRTSTAKLVDGTIDIATTYPSGSPKPNSYTVLNGEGITVNRKKPFGAFFSAGPNLDKAGNNNLLRVGAYSGADFNTSTYEVNQTIIFNPNRDAFQILRDCTLKIDVTLRHQGDGTSSQSPYVYTAIVVDQDITKLTLKPEYGYIQAIGSYGSNVPNLRFISGGSYVVNFKKGDYGALRLSLASGKYSFISSVPSMQITEVFSID